MCDESGGDGGGGARGEVLLLANGRDHKTTLGDVCVSECVCACVCMWVCVGVYVRVCVCLVYGEVIKKG